MAAKELYDYLTVATPDNDVTLDVSPQDVLTEDCSMNQIIHPGDDGSEEVVTLDSDVVCYVTLKWNAISESDAGTILDFWLNAAKGNGVAESFKWTHPTDGHTYVVKFRENVTRTLEPAGIFGFSTVRLKVIGYIADA